jgi:hypothetical protein
LVTSGGGGLVVTSGKSKGIDASQCTPPDACFGSGCYLHSFPEMAIPPACSVGSDAFLPGVPGQDAGGGATVDKEQCARKCVNAAASSSMPYCRFWKFGTNGNWCQLFKDDGVASPGWPIQGAANSSQSTVFSGTIPGNGC